VRSAIPATVCGMMIGISMMLSTTPLPGKSRLARKYASGTPNTNAMAVAASAVYIVKRIDFITAESLTASITPDRLEMSCPKTMWRSGVSMNARITRPSSRKTVSMRSCFGVRVCIVGRCVCGCSNLGCGCFCV